MTPIPGSLDEGLQFHRAGDLQRAEQIYQGILAREPRHSETLHLLGFISQQRRQYEQAVSYISQAVAISPANAVYHCNLGAAYKLTGQLENAMRCFRRAVELKPGLADAQYNLGVVLDLLQQPAEAAECYRQAIRAKHDHAEAHNNLGNAMQVLGQLDEAAESFRRALRLSPKNAQAHYNLGNILQIRGKLDDALVEYDQALALSPNYAEAYYNRGNLLLKRNQADDAARNFQEALRIRPGFAEAHNNLGLVFSSRKQFVQAIEHFTQAVTVRPDWATAHNQLAQAFAAEQRFDDAEASYRRAIACDPRFSGAYNNLGLTLLSLHRFAEAQMSFQRALEIDPHLPEAHYNLGNLYRWQNDPDRARREFEAAIASRPDYIEARLNLGAVLETLGQSQRATECFQEVLRLNPHHADAHTNLGLLSKAEGRVVDAEASFREAFRSQPRPMLRVLANTLLPPIYESTADVLAWRRQFTKNVAALHRDGVRLNPTRDCFASVFYLPYQGLNDRDLNCEFARLYAGSEPAQAATPRQDTPRPAGARLRIGFISRHFSNHTISKLMQGIIAHLSRERFTTVVFSIGRPLAEVATSVRNSADEYRDLSTDPDLARATLAASDLDVLFYADLGMDPLTYALAFQRFAPVQCVTWGHPVTTGIPTIDYFISSELLEPADADDHYSERLIRLRTLPTYYERPVPPAVLKTRRELDLPADSHVYLCPQSLFKLHPDFDVLLASILARDPQGRIVLVESEHPAWNVQLQNRFARTLGALASRVQFVPKQNHADFLSLLASSDVMLDPLHFGGGNTTYEALSLGVPIVTLPADYMRGRVTSGCYRKMGVSDCTVCSPAEYVDLAVRLGTDTAFRHTIAGKIRSASHVLFEDRGAIEELERFFEWAVRSAREPDCDSGAGAVSVAPDWHSNDSLASESALKVPTAGNSLAEILTTCTCPACGHHIAVPFYDGGRQPLATLAWPASAEEARAMKRLPLSFMRCIDCGHVYNSEFNYAEVPYSEKPNLMFNKGAVWTTHLRRIRDLILERMPERPIVVEVGCGDGHLLRALAEARPAGRYIGFDPSGAIDDGHGAIEGRRELFEPSRHLAELRPDLIVSRHVLEHLMNPLAFVQALAFASSWERVETQLLIEVPCIDGVFAAGRTVDFFYEHNSNFTSRSLERLLSRCASSVELVERGYKDEVVYGLARFQHRADQVDFAAEALDFRERTRAARTTMLQAIADLRQSGKRIAVWGGTGKAAAFINQYGLDVETFPLVVDSDPDKAGTFVPGTGQEIRFRDVLLSDPVDVILIATQWRAHDIALEIERCGIRYRQIVLEHQGRLVDYFHDEHPYLSRDKAA